jgi:iron(III) transport system substrate-binding protein
MNSSTPGNEIQSRAERQSLAGRRQSGVILARTAFLLLWLVCAGIPLGNLRAAGKSVVIYTSQDEEYAGPVFQEFERQTGVKVRPVFDSEAVKTVGLVNRLLAERANPQCDVFWNNEEMRTRMLATRGLFRETNGWAETGYRSRRLVVNTNLLSIALAPHRFSEATNSAWRGKIALAYPMFGTTATHFMALRQAWGDAGWQAWCRALQANKPLLVDGNSVVVKLVGAGEATIGFTDSDDIADAQRESLPVASLPLGDESLLIHNTVAVLRGAPHPETAEQLFEYLQSKTVLERLFREHALESIAPGEPADQPGLKVNWSALLRDLDGASAETKEIFLR